MSVAPQTPESPLSAAQVAEILQHIAEWRAAERNDGMMPDRKMVARVVRSFELEIATGTPHCTCCHKPRSRDPKLWGRAPTSNPAGGTP